MNTFMGSPDCNTLVCVLGKYNGWRPKGRRIKVIFLGYHIDGAGIRQGIDALRRGFADEARVWKGRHCFGMIDWECATPEPESLRAAWDEAIPVVGYKPRPRSEWASRPVPQWSEEV